MKIAFICVHNSCRSQMAEAFARVIGLGVFEAYSAGTHIGTKINPDAVAVMREIGVDMELQQRPKVLLPQPSTIEENAFNLIRTRIGCDALIPENSKRQFSDGLVCAMEVWVFNCPLVARNTGDDFSFLP